MLLASIFKIERRAIVSIIRFISDLSIEMPGYECLTVATSIFEFVNLYYRMNTIALILIYMHNARSYYLRVFQYPAPEQGREQG